MFALSAKGIKDLFLSKKASAVEIAKYFINRSKKIDPQISAFLHLFEKRMLEKAASLDKKMQEKKSLGKLAAAPIAIKNNICIKDEITSCGSKMLENFRSLFDSSSVKNLEEEDALIIGTTNLDEFGMGSSCENSAFMKTKNPWNLSCVPGGSSGGSAAAVAARVCPLALGSDTGGSVRQPASLSGISGFKPTYGRVSRYGLVAYGSSLDTIGPLAHNVYDIALVMEVLARRCPMDATSLPIPNETFTDNLKTGLKGVQVGVPYSFLTDLPGDTRKVFENAVSTFKDLGAVIKEVDLDILKYSIPVYYILATAEASTNLARFDGIRYGHRSKSAHTLEDIYDLSREEGFGSEVKRRIILGTYVLSAGFKDAYYKKGQKARTLIIEAFEKAYARCDFIIMPTSPGPAFKLGEIQDPVQMYLQDLFTVCANLAGIPAISTPMGFSQSKLPLGLQILGPVLHDSLVINYAYNFERAHDFHLRIPEQFDKEMI